MTLFERYKKFDEAVEKQILTKKNVRTDDKATAAINGNKIKYGTLIVDSYYTLEKKLVLTVEYFKSKFDDYEYINVYDAIEGYNIEEEINSKFN